MPQRAVAQEALVRNVEQVIQSLKDESVSVRVDAAYELTQISIEVPRDSDGLPISISRFIKWPEAELAVPALIEALKDTSHEVRGFAARALSRYGDHASSAEPALVQVLKDDEYAWVREEAAYAIGHLGSCLWEKHEATKEAVQALTEALQDHWRELGAGVANALGRCRHPGAVPVLAKVLEEALKDLMKGETKTLSYDATLISMEIAKALGHIGPKAQSAVSVLLDVLKHPIAYELIREAVVALGRIGGGVEAQSSVPVLTYYLYSSKVRVEAAYALGGLGPGAKSAVPQLVKLSREALIRFENDDEEFGWAAIYALGCIEPTVLLEILEDENGRIRTWAAQRLGTMGPQAKFAVPALTKALNDRWSWVRAEAANALGQIGPEARAAIPALEDALKDTNADVRAEVSEALRAINRPPVPDFRSR
jgi:HEAT repeat protein